MAKKTVLVTGGLGMIGFAVAKKLLSDGNYFVRIADNKSSTGHDYIAVEQELQDAEIYYVDLSNSVEASRVMEGVSICIHMAAIVGGIANFHQLPFTLLHNNFGLFNTVFKAAIEQHVEQFIYTSSSMVYERAQQFPTDEEYLKTCLTPLSAYGFNKLGGEYYCFAAWEEFGLPFTIIRPFNAYGQGEEPSSEPGLAHVIPDLIGKILKGQYPIEILGNGTQTRCFTHVKDIARAITSAIAYSNALNQTFNISSQREITVLELARMIWKIAGYEIQDFSYVCQPAYKVDVQRRWPKTEKATRLLGWEAQVTLEEGLSDLVLWFRQHVIKP